jgi:RimJ/RimL family protein N-acetyltransferase
VGNAPQLRTRRLLLRRWREQDLDPWAEMNADAEVMEHFPAPLSRAQSAHFIERIEACFQERGYGEWAVELPGEAGFIGCVGLAPVERRDFPFAPSVELAWRLRRPYWGRGLASEAAAAAMAFAFGELELQALVAYTAERNLRSQRVMERLGMRRDPGEDFAHPSLSVGHPLRPHVLYRAEASA